MSLAVVRAQSAAGTPALAQSVDSALKVVFALLPTKLGQSADAVSPLLATSIRCWLHDLTCD
jgi:hypothetical protein